MKRWLPYLGIALGVGLVVYAIFFGRTEEERVRERLAELGASVSFRSTGESVVVRGARLRKEFAELFSKDVALAIPELGGIERGRGPLVDAATEAPQHVATLEVDLHDLQIRLDDSKEHALAIGTAHLTYTVRDGAREKDDRTVSLRLDREDKTWRVTNVSVSPSADTHAEKSGVAPLKDPN